MIISQIGSDEARCHWWDPTERRFGGVCLPVSVLIEAERVNETGRTRKQYAELLEDVCAMSRAAQEQLVAFVKKQWG